MGIRMKDDKETRYIELGYFLKMRRSKILPSQVGLPNGSRRRTPGLRREEVAQLAGISLTWYTWLEQGRPIKISNYLIESLCHVLLLNKEERSHLFILAAKSLPINNVEQNQITAALRSVLDSLDIIPAYIMDNRWNIIAWNESASKVFYDFNKIDPEERNIVGMMFTNHEYMELFDDWAFHARGILARFRATCGRYVDDDWFKVLVSRLKTESTFFNEWWSMYDVHGMSDVIKQITHPIVGSLSFEFSSFDVSNNTNLKLILHTPLADTDTREKIILLMKET
jgi:transcriptional regulator with XRE-family HTH domain